MYFSVGYPSTTQGSTNILGLGLKSAAFSRRGFTPTYATNMLVDPVGKKVYGGLIPSGDVSVLHGKSNCICSDFHGLQSYKSGEAIVRYQVVAPLPESVAFVDVGISGQVIGHVKVEDGAMTPEVDPMKAILVGMGWPKIDLAQVASSAEPAKSVIDLETSVADLEGTVTTRATPKQISVALASDVLFATDSATLSPKAQGVLRRAAADVKAAGGTGTLNISATPTTPARPRTTWTCPGAGQQPWPPASNPCSRRMSDCRPRARARPTRSPPTRPPRVGH